MFNGRLVKRSWGWYWTILDRGDFKLKLLWFKKNGELSMQRHKFRNELWLFMRGAGIFKLDEKTNAVSSGAYYQIEVNQWHKYKAINGTLVFEIQYGESCEEGDIERI